MQSAVNGDASPNYTGILSAPATSTRRNSKSAEGGKDSVKRYKMSEARKNNHLKLDINYRNSSLGIFTGKL